ncbi:hypothetical protein ACR8AL_07400 [Clavibacter sepedonicus]|nr:MULTISPECIES: hypothetical protein [Clavibacter]MBD5382480.1 hypothetical protein [Clavibacter sp.]UUK67232.1 hypothetical protein LRE50_15855 [Clavibacter sepedonicus]
MMRVPAIAMTEHLMWTRHGTVWATWRLQGLPKGFGTSEKTKESVHAHRALIQSFHGESLLLGLTADMDPVTLVNQMLDGVNILEHRGWAEEAMLTLDSLAERALGRREFWLAVPLRTGGLKNELRVAARQADTSAREMLALPLRPPSAHEITDALQAAGKIEEQLPDAFKAHRATVAEQVWIAAHAQNRGLQIDLAAPMPTGSPARGVATRFRRQASSPVRPSSVFPHPLLDEAGQSDRANKGARFDPLNRRFLKVTNLRDDITSYQVMLALSGSPKGGWDEDAKWMNRIDQLGVDADWAWRLRTSPALAARHRNKRTEANLSDQLEQQEGTAAITGGAGSSTRRR